MPDALKVVVKKNNVPEWTARLRRRVNLELNASAQRILAAAAEKAPRRTGALAESGQVEQLGFLLFDVVFGRGLPDGRAIYQEMGTRFHAAQPYLYPAFMEELPNIMRRLAITTQGRIKYSPGSGGPAITE